MATEDKRELRFFAEVKAGLGMARGGGKVAVLVVLVGVAVCWLIFK